MVRPVRGLVRCHFYNEKIYHSFWDIWTKIPGKDYINITNTFPKHGYSSFPTFGGKQVHSFGDQLLFVFATLISNSLPGNAWRLQGVGGTSFFLYFNSYLGKLPSSHMSTISPLFVLQTVKSLTVLLSIFYI